MTSTCVLNHRHNPERAREALPGTLACRGCTEQLRSALIGEDRFLNGIRSRIRGLAELHAELDEAMEGMSSGSGPRTSGTREQPLPFPPAVAGHRALIAEVLGSWVLQHMADNPETGPGTIAPRTTTWWLERRLDHALRSDWLPDYVLEVRELRTRALALLDPVRRMKCVIGQCIAADCDGWLVAEIVTNDALLPASIYCDRPADEYRESCGMEWPPHTWMQLGRKLGKDQAAA